MSSSSSLFQNNLKIPDLFIHDQSEFRSIEFCFLFLTSESFRQKSAEKQLKYISKFRINLGEQLQAIVTNELTSKNKTLLINHNPEIHNNFLDMDISLGVEDFVFVIQNIVRSHAFVIAENQNFSMNIDKPLNKKSKVIIILKENDDSYRPIFSSDDTYIFPHDHPSIKLIQSFNVNKTNNKNIYNTASSDNKTTTLQTDGEEEVDTRDVLIVDESDLVFEDFEDELTIKYHNKSFSQKFSDDEKSIHIQNLLASSSEKGTGITFLAMMNDYSPAENAVLGMGLYPVATVSKRIEDYEEYIDGFNRFKKMDPSKPLVQSNPKPYIFPTHFHETPPTNSPNAVSSIHINNSDIIRNSFTASFLKLDNSSDQIDFDYCIDNFTKPQMEAIMKHHNIEKRGSKNTLCSALLSFNFLEDNILDKVGNEFTVADLLTKIQEHNIVVEASVLNSKERLTKVLLQHNITDFVQPLFSFDELKDVALKHKIPIDDDSSVMFNSLISANLLLLSKSTPSVQNEGPCEVDDYVTAVLAAANTTHDPSNTHLEIFRSVPEDNIYLNGFYLNGNKASQKFHVFDIDNYFNILHNIQKFLPVKCSMHYFDGSVVQGTIVERIHNYVLKIKTADNKHTYYNLKNYLENAFYLYTELYEGYKYNKANLYDNVFFYINYYKYEDMVRFVSLNLPQYLKLFHAPLSDGATLNLVLDRFGTSLSTLNHSDMQSLLPHIDTVDTPKNNEVENSDNKKEQESASNANTRVSRLPFLAFDESNTSDLQKMVLMHKQNYYQIIYDRYSALYEEEHNNDTLDTKVSFDKSTDNKSEIVHQHIFNDFDDLKKHKRDMYPVYERNNDIELGDREYLTNTYLQNLKKHLSSYTQLFESFNEFHQAKHEKTFLKEIRYAKKVKHLEGSEQHGPSLVSNDPNNQHAPLMNNDGSKTSIINEHLEYLSAIIGITLTPSEVTYISTQTKNVYYPILTRFKLQKNPNSLKTQREKTLWDHFANTVAYCAFITLIAQYKYNITTIHKKCKDKFSLHGFPMDDQTDKTFSKYVACVLYGLFGTSNKLFASEEFIDSQLVAIIRFIFQYSPALKTVFDNITRTHADRAINDSESTDTSAVVEDIKPFYNAKSITEFIKKHITNTLTENFKMHSIKEHNPSTLLISHPPLQIVSSSRSPSSSTTRISLKLNQFDKDSVRLITLNRPDFYREESDDVNADEIMENLTVITNDFKDWYRFTFKNIIQKMVDTFILQKNSGDDVDNYYHIFKFNQFYMSLLENERFVAHKHVFESNAIGFTTNLPKLVLNIFTSVKTSLEQMFNTNDIYTYLDVETNASKRDLFVSFLKGFEVYLEKVMKDFEESKVSMEDLQKKAEVLREMDKQEKLAKYSDLDDDQMLIAMQLEQHLGIPVNFDDFQQAEDLENEELTQLSEEDDVPE
jgi:hypothetical protein